MARPRMHVHPAVRLLWLVCLAVALARPGAWTFAACLLGIGLVWARARPAPGTVLRGLWRLRWFLLILLVFYAWLTPGTPLFAGAPALLPTVQGLAQGGERLLALILLVVAVQLLLVTTSRGVLVAALHWWLRPLEALGVSADRVALRLVLVLEAAPALRERIAALSPRTAGDGWRQRLSAFAAEVFADVLRTAEHAPLTPVRVPVLPPVRLWSVALPVILLAGLIMIDSRAC
ncbi:CbiQ family ECF transporter T component [Aquisalimonas lutea]|uniref:CbiQ family ECF transporter T component n=1 Tax=Aquisalimonas lutea TaxID=1327750 RepID=UPI0025B2DF92|nr:CbiQ family ECF transporter T component [Aquisalimonas lutea]MDN3517751.1 CbiQ family ECF transporter T component [Aquisalimonas lutea]